MTDNDRADALLDRSLIEEIRRIERATGTSDVLSGCIARGDTAGAVRVAHTLKGTCRQLGAQALGNLFAEIEASAKAGDYAGAKRRFDGAGGLIAESLEALKHA
jgi:HPt (histidine-containing phosphotransfer) domain-containing protein